MVRWSCWQSTVPYRHQQATRHGPRRSLDDTSLGKSVVARFDGGTVPDGKARPLLTTMDRCIGHHLARAAAAFGGEDHVRTALALKVADHAAVFSKLHTDKALDLHAAIDPRLVLSCEAQDLDKMLGTCLTMPANGRASGSS